MPTTTQPDTDSDTNAATTPPQEEIRELRIAASAIPQLREALLQPDGNERVAYAACATSGPALVCTELYAVPDTGMAVSTPQACRPAQAVERRYLSHVTHDGYHPFIVHSHPFTDTAWFSEQDTTLMHEYLEWLRPLFPDRTLVFGVLAQDQLQCYAIPPAAEPKTDPNDPAAVNRLPVRIVGDWTLKQPLSTGTKTAAALADVDWERYDRSIRALGLDGQATLADTHLAIVGCGGIGSHVAVNLARLGANRLTLIDPDYVERSNLPRLRGAQPGDIDHPKVQVIQQACLRANPDCEVTTVSTPVQTAPAATTLTDQSIDAIIGCVDQVTARYWLNEYAVAHVLPYIDVGVRIDVNEATGGIEQEVIVLQTVAPGVTACFDCLQRGDPQQAHLEQADEATLEEELDRGYISGADLAPEPAILDLNAAAAAKTVRMVKQLVTGVQAPPSLLRYDATSYDLTTMGTTPSSQCVTCGDHGVLASGDLPVRDAAALPQPGEQSPDPDSATASFPPAVTAFFTTDLTQR